MMQLALSPDGRFSDYGEVDGTPWVGDLDADGYFEMVTRTNDGYVHVFDLSGMYAPSLIEWGQFAHDPHHTSRYEYTGGSFKGEPGSGTATLALHQNVPNPFNPATTISYSLGVPVPVTLKIYAASGRVVATLVDEVQAPGEHTLEWDGRGGDGRSVSSGVYFYRLQAGAAVETRKLLLVK